MYAYALTPQLSMGFIILLVKSLGSQEIDITVVRCLQCTHDVYFGTKVEKNTKLQLPKCFISRRKFVCWNRHGLHSANSMTCILSLRFPVKALDNTSFRFHVFFWFVVFYAWKCNPRDLVTWTECLDVPQIKTEAGKKSCGHGF